MLNNFWNSGNIIFCMLPIYTKLIHFSRANFGNLKGDAWGGNVEDTDDVNLLAHKLIEGTVDDLLIQLLSQDILAGKAVETQLLKKRNSLIWLIAYCKFFLVYLK